MQRRSRTYKNYQSSRTPPQIPSQTVEAYLQTLVNKIQEVNLKVETYEAQNKQLHAQHAKQEQNMNDLTKLNTELELKIIKISHILSDTLHSMYTNMNSLNSKHDKNLEKIINLMTQNSKDIIVTTITEVLKDKTAIK